MSGKLIDFDILIDDAFANICTDSTLAPIDKNYLLSVVNKYEGGKWRMNLFREFIFNNLAELASRRMSVKPWLTKACPGWWPLPRS